MEGEDSVAASQHWKGVSCEAKTALLAHEGEPWNIWGKDLQ